MSHQLGYDRPRPHNNALTITATICCIASGPASFGLAALASNVVLPSQTTDLLCNLSFGIVLTASLVLGIIARVRLPSPPAPHGRLLANLAIASTVVWGVLIYLYSCAVDIIGGLSPTAHPHHWKERP